jgi:hypothetical protein
MLPEKSAYFYDVVILWEADKQAPIDSHGLKKLSTFETLSGLFCSLPENGALFSDKNAVLF